MQPLHRCSLAPSPGPGIPASLRGQSPIGRMVVLGHCGFQDSAAPFLRDLSLPRSWASVFLPLLLLTVASPAVLSVKGGTRGMGRQERAFNKASRFPTGKGRPPEAV